MPSDSKDLARNIIPPAIIDLFPNDECTIEDEVEFIEIIKRKVPDLLFLHKCIKDFSHWKYVFYKIYELLKKRIQVLKDLQSNGSSDIDSITFNERRIDMVINLINELVSRISNSVDQFSFPYFSEILEITSDLNIIKNIVVLDINMIRNKYEHKDNGPSFCILNSWLIPFLKLFHYFQSDYPRMIKVISDSFINEPIFDVISHSCKEILRAVLGHGDALIQIIEDNTLLQIKNKHTFENALLSKILEQTGIEKTDKHKYFKLRGEVALVSYFLNKDLTKKLLDIMPLIHVFEGIEISTTPLIFFLGLFMDYINTADDQPELFVVFEDCHQEYQSILKPSYMDIVVEKTRELSSAICSKSEDLQEKVETLSLYLFSVTLEVELYKVIPSLEKSKSDIDDMMRKLLSFELESQTVNKEPAVFEIWRVIQELYKENYSSVKDENSNLLAILSNLYKDQVNLLMGRTVYFVSCFFSLTLEDFIDENEDVQKRFKDEYYVTGNQIIEEMINMVECFDFNSNYTSVIVLFRMFSVFQELGEYHVCAELKLPIRMIKKVESFIEWSFTQDFADYFDKFPDQILLNKLVIIVLDLVAGVVMSDEDANELTGRKEYMTYMSSFASIEFLSKKIEAQTPLWTNEYTMKTQESIIRYYLAMHLSSQIFTLRDEETEYFVYYSYERLQQVWRIMLKYNNDEKYMIQEFQDTIQIISNLIERGDDKIPYWKLFDRELLEVFYCECLLNLEVDFDLTEEDKLYEIISSFNSHQNDQFVLFVSNFVTTTNIVVESVLNEADALHRLYEQNDPKFTKQLFKLEARVFDLSKRFRTCFDSVSAGSISKLDPEHIMLVYFTRLLTSPIAYMLDKGKINNLINWTQTYINQEALLLRVVSHYAAKVPEIMKMVNSQLQGKDEARGLFRKKIDLINRSLSRPRHFFVETIADDPKEIYNVNSQLFPIIALNLLLRDSSPQCVLKALLNLFENSMQEMTNIMVVMQELFAKTQIDRAIQQYPNTDFFTESYFLADHFEDKDIKQYFIKKTKSLVEMLSISDEAKSEEENLLRQIGVLTVLQDFLGNMNEENEAKLWNHMPGSFEKVLESCFELVFKFTEIALNYLDSTTEPPAESLIGPQMPCLLRDKERFSLALRRIERLIADYFSKGKQMALSLTNISQKLAKPQIVLFKRSFVVLTRYIDRIDLRLLSLRSLGDKGESSIYFNNIINSIYTCYITILNLLKQEIEETQEKEGQKDNVSQGAFNAWKKGSRTGTRKKPWKKGKSAARIREEPSEDINGHQEDIELPIEDVEEPDFGSDETENYMAIVSKLMLRVIPFYNLHNLSNLINYNYINALKEVIERYTSLAESYRKSGEEKGIVVDQSDELIVKIYKNPLVNGVRTLSSALLYLVDTQMNDKANQSKNKVLQEEECSFFFKAAISLIEGIGHLIGELDGEEILKTEDSQLIDVDLVATYDNIIFCLVKFAEDLVVYNLGDGSQIETFKKCFSLLCQVIKKWHSLCKPHHQIHHCLKEKPAVMVLYLGFVALQTEDNKFLLDEQLLSIMMNYCGHYFYLIQELYAIQAYDPEIILTLKLKALGYLDKSGSRIFQNRMIKKLEKYWDEKCLEIWENNFVIQDAVENTDNKHSTKIIAMKPNPNITFERITTNIEGKRVEIPSLKFFREGISKNARIVVEVAMKSIFTNVKQNITQLMQACDPDDVALGDIVKRIQEQTLCLSLLISNYPELSLLLSSYHMEDIIDIPEEFTEILPRSNQKETFLTFYIRYVCYLYTGFGYNLLECLVKKTETPLLIEYEGEPLLLSSYNELLIFQEIFKVLEETLESSPERFLKSIYSITVWETVSIISSKLKLVGEPGRNFKIQIINKLYSICYRALEICNAYNKQDRIQNKSLEKLIFVFLIRLSEAEVAITFEEQTTQSRNLADKLNLSKREVKWGYAVLRDHFHREAPLDINQIQSSILLANDNASLGAESLTKYAPELYGIDIPTIVRVFSETTDRFDGAIVAYRTSQAQQDELNDLLKNYELNMKPHSSARLVEVAKVLKKHFNTYMYYAEGFPTNDFELNRTCLSPNSNLYGYFVPKSSPSPTNPKFRVFVKKALKWKLKQKNQEDAVQAFNSSPEKSKQEGAFASLIKKIGFEKVKKLIQENKERVKLMIQNQHESFLMAKLEALCKENISIDQMMSVDTSVENLTFFNAQSNMDQKLILLLANKDFLKTLTEEMQEQAKSIRKVVFDKETKKRRNDDDYDDEFDDDEEEEEDDEEDEEDDDEDDDDEEEEEEEKTGERNFDEMNQDEKEIKKSWSKKKKGKLEVPEEEKKEQLEVGKDAGIMKDVTKLESKQLKKKEKEEEEEENVDGSGSEYEDVSEFSGDEEENDEEKDTKTKDEKEQKEHKEGEEKEKEKESMTRTNEEEKKVDQAHAERKGKEEEDKEDEDNDSDYEEVSDFSEGEDEKETKEKELVKKDVVIQEKEKSESKDQAKQEEKEEKNEGEAMNQKNKEGRKAEYQDEEGDEEYEDVSEFSEEDEKEGEREKKSSQEAPKELKVEAKESVLFLNEKPILKQEEIEEEKKEEGLTVEKQVKGKGKKKHKDTDSVSSSCHTEQRSEIGDRDMNFDENYDDEYYSDGIDNEDDCGIGSNYDEMAELKDLAEINKEMAVFKGLMSTYNKVEKALQEAHIVPRPSKALGGVAGIEGTEENLKEWAEQIFYILSSSKKGPNDDDNDAVDLFDLDTYTLVSRFLILTLLDNKRETTIVPLLVFYVMGNYMRELKDLPTSTASHKEVILMFIYQYALRRPNLFLNKLRWEEYKGYLDKEVENRDGTFSLLDMMFRFCFIDVRSRSLNKTSRDLLESLVVFLLSIRLKSKDNNYPSFLKAICQDSSTVPLDNETIQTFFENSGKSSVFQDEWSFKQLCKCLEYLSEVAPLKKNILLVCEQLIKAFVSEEKSSLDSLVKQANEDLHKDAPPSLAMKSYYNISLSRLKLQIPEVLRIFSSLITEQAEDIEVRNFTQKTDIIKTELKEISTSYMEALDALYKLKQKGSVEYATTLYRKLKNMLEVPIQTYLCLAKVKGAVTADLKSETLQAPPGLERITSSLSNSGSQEGLIPWLKRNKDFINSLMKLSNPKHKDSNLWLVKKLPWILDFELKEKIFRDALRRNENEEEDEDDEINLQALFIRRSHLLESTIRELERNDKPDLLQSFKIEFIHEPGVDQGGLKKEWLTLLSKEIFDPLIGLFKLSANMRTLHPNPLSVIQPGQMGYFKLAGLIVGLAIKERIPLDINLSKSFLKLIMGSQPNLNDLEDIEPELFNSLNWMLNNDIKVLELEQPFIYELDVFGTKISQELIENGSNIWVDDTNKELFITKTCLAKALKEVEKQVQSFREGFLEVIPEDLIGLFTIGELEILISGKSEIDVQDLIKHTLYKDIGKDNILVKWFWEIVEIMDQNMLANLLFFISGSSKVPHGGFKTSPITLMRGSEITSSLPVAHTCFSELEIPAYESKEQFYEKLVLAISEGKEGFYIA